MDCPGGRWSHCPPEAFKGRPDTALSAMVPGGDGSQCGFDDTEVFSRLAGVCSWPARAGGAARARGSAQGQGTGLGPEDGAEPPGCLTRRPRSSNMTQSQRLLNIFFFFLVVTGVFSESRAHASPLSASLADALHGGSARRLPAASPRRSRGSFPRRRPRPSAPLPAAVPQARAPPSGGGARPPAARSAYLGPLHGAGRGRRRQRLPFVSGAARAVGAGGREGARAAELRPSLGSRPQPAAGRGRRRSGPSPASPARREEGAGSAAGLSGDRREEAGPGRPAPCELGAGGGGGERPSPAESGRVRPQLEPPRRGLAAPGPTFVGVAAGGAGAAAGAGAARRSPPGAGGGWAGMRPQLSP